MLQTREELELEVVTHYRMLIHALKACSGTAWMEIDLTIAQLRTLLVLAEEGPLVIGQIAQRMGIDLSTGGHLVDRLVQAGLAERTEDAEDRRSGTGHPRDEALGVRRDSLDHGTDDRRDRTQEVALSSPGSSPTKGLHGLSSP